MSKTDILKADPKYRRADVAIGFRHTVEDKRIDKAGGRYGAGIIRGASLIATGEALGHGMWIDNEFLQAVGDQFNSSQGVKVRYTHPEMSGDGLATHIGRAYGATVHGEYVAADIHFTKSGRNTPDGDLGGHVMDQAEETPEDFGMSIVFDFDDAAERQFIKENSEDGSFSSPDPMNVHNLPHARLKSLRAADFVGDPAANENGVFFGMPEDLDSAVSYAIGISDEPVSCRQLSDVSPDRARGFVQRFLKSHGLEIKEASNMTTALAKAPVETADQPKPDDKVKEATVESQKSGVAGYSEQVVTFAEFKDAFPNDEQFAKDAYCEGWTMRQAETQYRNKQEDENAKLRERLEALEQKLSAVKFTGGEETPIEGTSDSGKPKRKSPAEMLLSHRSRN